MDDHSFTDRVIKFLPVVMFIGGFVCNSLTLIRVDRMSDNLILLGYLVALAAMIVICLRAQAEAIQADLLEKLAPHFRWVMQFLIGGLLSSYVVSYFKIASWPRASVFILLLVFLLVAKEFLEHQLENPKLLAALFFFCLFSFLAYFLPVVLARAATVIFLFAGWISLGISLWVLALAQSEHPREERTRPRLCIVATYVMLNILYFANLIPPVPLALKSGGIFHSVERIDGAYQVQHVPTPLYRFWKDWDDPFYLAPGEAVFCYSAIFAPRDVRVPVQHRWSRYTERTDWAQMDLIRLETTGGRDSGYVGFSRKTELPPGEWKVEVETQEGEILGRLYFTVIPTPEGHAPLITRTIE